jgi:hypothetical protein
MFLHNLLNVLVQIANKMGFQKKIYKCFQAQELMTSHGLIIMTAVTLTHLMQILICFMKKHNVP